MSRAVLDANVLVSGMLGYRRTASTPGALLRHWYAHDFELIVAEPLIGEVVRTLTKTYFAERIDPEDLTLLVAALTDYATRTEISVVVLGVATHPEDDVILAAAVSAQAEYLVTGDAKLQQLGSFQGVAIISPRAFLTLLEA